MTYEEKYIDKCIEDMCGEIFAIRLKRVTLTSGANGEDKYEFIHPMKNDDGMGVYIIYNYETQNVYVDVAYNFAEDVENAFKLLEEGEHQCELLQQAYQIYGEDNFGCCAIFRVENFKLLPHAKNITSDTLLKLGYHLYNGKKLSGMEYTLSEA